MIPTVARANERPTLDCALAEWQALSVPILIALDVDDNSVARRVAASPPVRLLAYISRFSFSYYVFQWISMWLVASAFVGSWKCDHHALSDDFITDQIPGGTVAWLAANVASNGAFAFVSLHLFEEASNRALKTRIERTLGRRAPPLN